MTEDKEKARRAADDSAQTIVIPISAGLYGIPVPSGGNYTDASGNQWVADTIEYREGVWKLIHRIGRRKLTSLKAISENTSVPGCSVCPIEKTDIYKNAGVPSMCTLGTFKAWCVPEEGKWHAAVNGAITLLVAPPKGSGYTVDTLNAYLTEHVTEETPLCFYAQLEKPVEAALPENSALKLLAGENTIANDANAWMTAAYISR